MESLYDGHLHHAHDVHVDEHFIFVGNSNVDSCTLDDCKGDDASGIILKSIYTKAIIINTGSGLAGSIPT